MAPEKLTDNSSKKYEYLVYLIFIIVTISLYWQATGYAFVWDDLGFHLAGHKILTNFTFPDIADIWSNTDDMYMPLPFTIWGAIKIAGGGEFDPFLFHSLNIIFHLACGIIIYHLLRELQTGIFPAAAGTIFFLIHPIQTEIVAWVSGFRGLCAALTGFTALLLLLKAERNPEKLSQTCLYYLSIFFYLLALASKPSATVIPVFMLSLLIFVRKRKLKSTMVILTPYLMLTLLGIILHLVHSRKFILQAVTPFWARPFLWFDSINFYLGKLLIPVKFAVSYARRPEIITVGRFFLFSWIPSLLIALLLFKKNSKQTLLKAAFLIFITGILPVSGLIPFIFQEWSTVADRYLYFSMFGAALAISVLFEKFRFQVFRIAMLILFIALFSYNLLFQVPTWKSEFTLWENCLFVSPQEVKAYFNRGIAFSQTDNFLGALLDYNKAIEMDSTYTEAYHARGDLFRSIGRFDLEFRDLNKALSINPHYYAARLNLGNNYFDQQDYLKAIEQYNYAIQINDHDFRCYFNRGNAYYQLGQYDDAVNSYTAAIKLNSRHPGSYRNRALALYYLNRLESARDDFVTLRQLTGEFDEELEQIFK